MTEKEEKAYIQGQRVVYTRLLDECLKHLDWKGGDAAELLKEREETIAVLRQIGELTGDNDWDDDTYIPDILRSHVLPHVESFGGDE